jgi:arginyl-tRNA--protein-N-Asp/Glu arginylyltransferase
MESEKFAFMERLFLGRCSGHLNSITYNGTNTIHSYLAAMFVEVHTPQQLTGQELDAYLERGWFRMGQTIFTTNFAHVQDRMLSTIWLRVQLFEYERDVAHTKLLSRNSRFITRIKHAELTEDKEVLYARYREMLSFTVSDSLHHLLLGKGDGSSIYNTYEVTLYDQDKLVGCGFFDLGGNSAQGIVSFYDPEYKKYSPGKYLIYSKIQFCKDLGLQYFYPGYFVPGNPFFDYKLKIARSALQFLHISSASWRNISTFTENDIPVQTMGTKLNALKLLLEKAGIESQVLKYEFFDAGLIPEMRNTGLLDFPLFLHLGNVAEEPVNVLVVFDVCDDQFQLLVCAPVWKPDRTNPDATFYSSFFLKPVQEVYRSPDADVMADLLVRINQHTPIRKP